MHRIIIDSGSSIREGSRTISVADELTSSGELTTILTSPIVGASIHDGELESRTSTVIENPLYNAWFTLKALGVINSDAMQEVKEILGTDYHPVLQSICDSLEVDNAGPMKGMIACINKAFKADLLSIKRYSNSFPLEGRLRKLDESLLEQFALGRDVGKAALELSESRSFLVDTNQRLHRLLGVATIAGLVTTAYIGGILPVPEP